jgi:cytidine deaminase
VSDIDWDDLEARAVAVQARAHAPYSKFAVGAALLGENGTVYVGANVENASYGLCLCAERSALAAAIADGTHRFRALAVVTPAKKAATCCGSCRQVLSEFPPSFEVRCFTNDGDRITTTVDELLPYAFGPGHLDGNDA